MEKAVEHALGSEKLIAQIIQCESERQVLMNMRKNLVPFPLTGMVGLYAFDGAHAAGM